MFSAGVASDQMMLIAPAIENNKSSLIRRCCHFLLVAIHFCDADEGTGDTPFYKTVYSVESRHAVQNIDSAFEMTTKKQAASRPPAFSGFDPAHLPELIETIEVTFIRMEQMDDDVSVIHKDPAAGRFPFDVLDSQLVLVFQLK